MHRSQLVSKNVFFLELCVFLTAWRGGRDLYGSPPILCAEQLESLPSGSQNNRRWYLEGMKPLIWLQDLFMSLKWVLFGKVICFLGRAKAQLTCGQDYWIWSYDVWLWLVDSRHSQFGRTSVSVFGSSQVKLNCDFLPPCIFHISYSIRLLKESQDASPPQRSI